MTNEEKLSMLKQPSVKLRYKIELLNEFLNVESTLTSSVASLTMSINATSDIRKTAVLKMIVEDNSFTEEGFEMNWLDKAVRLSIGVSNGLEYYYYTLGTMLLGSDSYEYSADKNELTLQLNDIMSSGTAERGSQIGTDVVVEHEHNIKNVLEAFVARYMPFSKTNISEFPDVIPYDQEFEAGVYPLEVLKTIVGLFPTYEQYYDDEGVYNAKAIPTRVNEMCALCDHKDDLFIDDMIISEKRSFNFSGIKNTTEIWGRTLDYDYVASNCVSTGATYALTFPTELETVEVPADWCFVPDVDSKASPQIQFTLVDDKTKGTTKTVTLELLDTNENSLTAGALTAGRSYVFQSVSRIEDGQTVTKLLLQGQRQIHVIVREVNKQPSEQDIADDKSFNACEDIYYVVNPDSPYACDRGGQEMRYGEIRQVLRDGDYASIYTTDLAIQRGKYENYLRARMNTDVELSTILIPFLTVNQKIQYTSPRTNEVHQYMVKSIDMDFSQFTMTMKLSRFYNYYPF